MHNTSSDLTHHSRVRDETQVKECVIYTELTHRTQEYCRFTTTSSRVAWEMNFPKQALSPFEVRGVDRGQLPDLGSIMSKILPREEKNH